MSPTNDSAQHCEKPQFENHRLPDLLITLTKSSSNTTEKKCVNFPDASAGTAPMPALTLKPLWNRVYKSQTSKSLRYAILKIHKLVSVQVEPGKPGAEVSKKKTISQRKNLPIECAQGDQPLRCPNRVF